MKLYTQCFITQKLQRSVVSLVLIMCEESNSQISLIWTKHKMQASCMKNSMLFALERQIEAATDMNV